MNPTPPNEGQSDGRVIDDSTNVIHRRVATSSHVHLPSTVSDFGACSEHALAVTVPGTYDRVRLYCVDYVKYNVYFVDYEPRMFIHR